MGGREAAGYLGLRWQDILEAWRWSGPSLSTDSTRCSQRVRDCGQEESRLSAGLSGLLEAEKEQAGAIGGTAPISAQHYPFGISSLLPEMTWPGQRGCQEDTAAGRERGGRTNRWQLETHPSEALLPSHSQGSHACCSCPPVSPLWVWAQEVRS